MPCRSHTRRTEPTKKSRTQSSRTASIDIGSVDAIETEAGWFWCELTIHAINGDTSSIGGLRQDSATRLKQCLRKAAKARAAASEPRLRQLNGQIEKILCGDTYTRHSTTDPLWRKIEPLVQRVDGKLVAESLPPAAALALQRLRKLRVETPFDVARERSNSAFVVGQRDAVQRATRDVTNNNLTPEQADAIATDEDATLVLAGAGTGKTAVITGKVANLVRNEGVQPKDVLVLAFNKKAAADILHRLPDDLREANVSTFHAFGYDVIGKATGKRPPLASWVADDSAFYRKIDELLTEALNSATRCGPVLDFLALFRNPVKSPFDFKDEKEYQTYLRRGDLRTFNGEKVKSFEEVQVANILSVNGVRYEYEKSYKVDTASSRHRPYKPDFYLVDYDIYIEHFALDEGGHPPKHFAGYRQQVDWKRSIHEQYETTLIETYSHQCNRGLLRQELENALVRHGVKLCPEPSRNLLDRLRELRGCPGRCWNSAAARVTFYATCSTSVVSPRPRR